MHHLQVADAFLFLRLVSSDRKLLIAAGGFDCLLRTRALIIWARCSCPVDAVVCRVKKFLSHAACPAQVFLCGRVCVCSSPSVVQASCEPVEASGMFSRRGCCFLCLLLRAAAGSFKCLLSKDIWRGPGDDGVIWIMGQRRGSRTRPGRVVDWGVQIASKVAGRDAALELCASS